MQMEKPTSGCCEWGQRWNYYSLYTQSEGLSVEQTSMKTHLHGRRLLDHDRILGLRRRRRRSEPFLLSGDQSSALTR
jgi:hypothetical protein